jgi:hypothetical protein
MENSEQFGWIISKSGEKARGARLAGFGACGVAAGLPIALGNLNCYNGFAPAIRGAMRKPNPIPAQTEPNLKEEKEKGDHAMTRKRKTRLLGILLAAALVLGLFPIGGSAANPFLPLWERVPDGEPRVFTDPETGEQRLYVYGSHDSRVSGYCGPDHVVWSAPVSDPTDWRYEGLAFHVDQLDGADYVDRDGVTKQLIVDVDANLRVMLYAPDVVYHPENKKYYMYLFVDGMWHVNPDPPAGLNRRRHPMFVASSDSPAGPFTDPQFVTLAFDPAVLVDDVKNEDGKSRVYLYWTPEENRNMHGAELDPDDMRTILPGTEHFPFGEEAGAPKNTMPDWTAPFYMFEGSSMRKVNGVYLMAYCRAVRPTQTSTEGISEIGWAYSDNPFGDPALGSPWTFGGVVVDNRGEQVADPYTGETTYTYTGGNIHGGMAEVGGQWYQIFHRNSNYGGKRQAMAEPFDLSFVDGVPVIEQVELTSQGFETGGLDPYQEQYASYACYMLPPSGASAIQFFSQVNSADSNFDPETERADWYPAMNIQNHSWLGYKYFDFGDGVADGQEAYLTLELAENAAGTVNVYASDPKASFSDPEQPKALIGSVALPGTKRAAHKVTAIVDKAALAGRKGIYLEFLSDAAGEICQLNKLQFSLAGVDKGALASAAAQAGKVRAGAFEAAGARALEDALAAAGAVLADPAARQSEADAAAAQLRAAVAALAPAPAFQAYAELLGLLQQAAALEEAAYTPASWAALQAVVDEGWAFVGAAGGGAAGGAAGGEGLEPLASLPAGYVDLVRRLKEALAGLAPAEAALPGAPAVISAGIDAAPASKAVFLEDLAAGGAAATFQVTGKGVADVGSLNFRLSFDAASMGAIDTDPDAGGFALGAGVAHARVRAEKLATPALSGYDTYSVYILADAGYTITVPDGVALLEARAPLKPFSGAQAATALLSHFDAVYYDAAYKGGDAGIDADARIGQAAASQALLAVSRYDVNRDGLVTLADVNQVRQYLGAAQGDPWAEAAAQCDVAAPAGVIDLADLTAVMAAYEAQVP